jgi:hypothetical protein
MKWRPLSSLKNAWLATLFFLAIGSAAYGQDSSWVYGTWKIENIIWLKKIQ